MLCWQGFPGNLNVTATYTLSDDNTLQLVIEATTDKTTPVNLAQHSYFNLNGNCRDTILNHVLYINGCSLLALSPQFQKQLQEQWRILSVMLLWLSYDTMQDERCSVELMCENLCQVLALQHSVTHVCR